MCRCARTHPSFALSKTFRPLDGISIGELAEKLVMDPTTLTRNLRPLELQGLVAVKPDRRDRRARSLQLTAGGAGRGRRSALWSKRSTPPCCH